MRTRSLAVGAALIAVLAIVAGCSSSAPKTSGSSTATAGASSPSAGTSAAPGSASAAGSASAGGNGLIGLDYPRSDTDFWNSYISYVPKFATQLNATIKTTNSQNDVQKLIANIQALQSEGAKAFVIAPQDTAAIGPELASLNAKNIPVVSIDTLPDTGNVYMVVRADNIAYGTKACEFLGKKLNGTGSVVMLEGDTASINGRDRTNAFNSCMKSEFPKIVVHGEPSKWDAATASSQLQTALTQDKNIKGIYMESSFALSGTLSVLKQAGLTAKTGQPGHVFIVSNDGIPQELSDIRNGLIDATVSQPADLYAEYGLYYAQAALEGKTFQPGPTDHNSMIVQVRPGVLEDELSAPLVTIDNVNDKTLWGNNL